MNPSAAFNEPTDDVMIVMGTAVSSGPNGGSSSSNRRPWIRKPFGFNSEWYHCFNDGSNCVDVACCWHASISAQYNTLLYGHQGVNGPDACVCCTLFLCDVCLWGIPSLYCLCLTRSMVRERFALRSECSDCCCDCALYMSGCCMCLACQDHRELNMRGFFPGGCCSEPDVRYPRSRLITERGGIVIQTVPTPQPRVVVVTEASSVPYNQNNNQYNNNNGGQPRYGYNQNQNRNHGGLSSGRYQSSSGQYSRSSNNYNSNNNPYGSDAGNNGSYRVGNVVSSYNDNFNANGNTYGNMNDNDDCSGGKDTPPYVDSCPYGQGAYTYEDTNTNSYASSQPPVPREGGGSEMAPTNSTAASASTAAADSGVQVQFDYTQPRKME